jgi:hypothetical protein
MGARVAKLAATALGKAMLGAKGGEGETRFTTGAVIEALGELASSLDPDAFTKLARDLLKHTQIRRDGEIFDLSIESRMDAAFGSDVVGLYKVIAFALEANNFFGLGSIGKLASLAKSQAIVSDKPKAA